MTTSHDVRQNVSHRIGNTPLAEAGSTNHLETTLFLSSPLVKHPTVPSHPQPFATVHTKL